MEMLYIIRRCKDTQRALCTLPKRGRDCFFVVSSHAPGNASSVAHPKKNLAYTLQNPHIYHRHTHKDPSVHYKRKGGDCFLWCRVTHQTMQVVRHVMIYLAYTLQQPHSYHRHTPKEPSVHPHIYHRHTHKEPSIQ